METRIFTGTMQHPGDFSQLHEAIDRRQVDPQGIIAILGKTEGNGGRNDFSRDLAVEISGRLLHDYRKTEGSPIDDSVLLSFSGGTEGIVTPHYRVFEIGAGQSARTAHKRLAAGRGRTRNFLPQEVGTTAMVYETGRVVTDIIGKAGIDPDDVHFVHIKGALPRENPPTSERNTMAYSRGASALGVALALGEVGKGAIADDIILKDWTLYSERASTSAKPGLPYSDILVLGNSPLWDSPFVIDHTVMQDILDTESVLALIKRLGQGSLNGTASQIAPRWHGIFAKAEADPRQMVRGFRHTMLSDDDIGDTRYARCVVSSILAALTGTSTVYVSTRAEHHGPLGGGPVAMIAAIDADASSSS
ncbi:MAG: barbiturase [Sulfobacillus benefaciens]|jgi:cyanuric acid amidohydrolase|uniref:Cyclic amide hydrolase n=1 Tax=Sulfobacillus benefaciens TaxID=453960 RepID=A0A2T2X903_9FIRM|nr:MAG: barbiturase [Sulfobacillus benefaciens]